MEELREMLEALRTYGALGSAVICRDGTIISADISKETNPETFAIMMATILGAAVTAASELNKAPPRLVIAESEDSKIILRSMGGKEFIAVIVPKDKNEKEILGRCEEILKIISQI